MITLYGIENCDSVKKARNWLSIHSIDYHFHDFRQDGVDPDRVNTWLTELGWETLINKRSSSWKALSEDVRLRMDNNTALAAILELPALIKRPLLDTGNERLCGFSAASYKQLFSVHTL